jgi:hydrogenase maturation protease
MSNAATLILGLGNTILTDDRVGIEVGKRLFEDCGGERVDFLEASAGGLALLDAVCGYEKVIVIDAIQTGAEVGTLHTFKADDDIGSMRLASVHGIDFFTALETGRTLGMKVPGDIRIYAVEINDPFTFSEQMTPDVERAVPGIVKEILKREFGRE